ncbi:SdrD B-like domain-containing protein [Neolewinella aurantiaca]|uniref:SdrD B-like domain-containing protein n=1 Tax=Neolewinella aurantiaca TaxID=2602767 RepID=UPI00165087E1|nr:SdrD B-like domain-containing protein [Neolewinella aurantiaca]
MALVFLSSSAFAQLNVTVTGEDISCFGLANGSATAAVSNGTAPFTYQWSNGGATATITNLNAGPYSVTVTDINGLSGAGAVTLSEPTRVTAVISEAGECSAPFVIAAEPQGGVVPYTYNWSTGADTRAVSVPAGDYCVTVVDANLCGYVACTTVDENPPAVTLVDVDAQCDGSDDGAITANPSGGVAPYSYSWTTGANTRTITGLAPGVYRVTLTDARGCTATANAVIDEPDPITGNIFGDNTVCPGEADAFIRIAPQGGTPPYSYVWSPGGQTGQGIGPLGAGTYGVTVTDANECTLVDTYVITESPEVDVVITGDMLLCGAGTTGSLTASPVSGPASQYTYLWNTGATSPTINNVTPGDYTVTATDVNGCTATATATVRLINLSLSLNSTATTCIDAADGTATVVATGGDMPYLYQWSNGQTTQTITGLTPGVYGVTVTEANNCKVSGNIQVGAPPALNISVTPTNIVCNGDNNGTIDVTVTGGTPAYSYLWNDGSTAEDRTNLSAGTYGLTVTDINGCTDNITVQINEPAVLDINEFITNVSCEGDASGSIELAVSGGTPAYSYAWSNGSTTRILNNLSAGVYTVTVTDANECTLVESYTITEPTAIDLSGIASNVTCFGENDGSIDLTVLGGSPAYIVNWSNGSNSEDLSNIGAGTYTVTVTDANECQETASFTITQPADLSLTATPSNLDCAGDNSGAIAVTVSGGTAPYQFAWSDGSTLEDRNGLAAGTYSVTATDANGCTESLSVTVSEPLALNGFTQITPVACDGGATGAINLTAERGTPPYSFVWSTGATTEDITGLTAGNYTVTITDANSCTLVQIWTVNTVAQIEITGNVENADCNDTSTGNIDITVSGGSGTYAYTWSNGALTQDLTNVPADTYTVSVTDANECTSVASFTVTEPDEINLSVTAPDIVCGGTNSGAITVFPAGGTGPYSYLWSNGDTGNMIDNIPAGAYTVTVTDANGCTDVTAGIVLDELPQLTCEITIDQEATNGNNGQLSVAVDGGTAPFTYAWSNNETTPTISNLSAGTYSVTVTDFAGCTTECIATLRALAGIGDFVWEDYNANGQQDPGEPGIEDYPVYLKNAAGVIIDSTRTDANGNYSFMGLEPGTYSILFIEPPGGTRTLSNSGDDTTDSDGDPDMNGMTDTYTLAPGEFNMTVDAGFFATPGGVIADPCNCLNNNTTDFDGQFTEILEIRSNPGQTWTILSNSNMYFLDSDDPPAAPNPVPVGTVIPQVSMDGDMAVYAFEFLLVDSFQYVSVISNGVYSLEIANQCFYPVVRYVEEPPASICRFDLPFLLDGFGLINNQPLPGDVIFTVNGETVLEIDPANLPVGENTITASFVPDNMDLCIADEELRFLLTEDCNAKLGDFVWQDTNGNGQQDPGEPGIEGVKVTVTSQDGTYMDMAFTDETGMYMFSVPPGTYKMTFDAPEDFVPTTVNSGNDATDSDMDPAMLMTGFYTVGPDEMDFTIDAGFINPCVANIVNPGTIGFSQEICGPGNVPDPFVEIAPATGGEGAIEYLWMFNTNDPNQDISFWQPIPNTNSPNYAPGAVSQTTYFTRCVRRNNCQYIESNVITIEVGDDAVADISGPTSICVGEEAIFQAVNPGNGASISWNFTGSSEVESTTGPLATTSWATFGSFSVTLTVTANGCTSTHTRNIAVLNNPNRCGGNLTANGSVNNLVSREVTIEWQVPYDGSDYSFMLERSTDGQNFEGVANVTSPVFVSGNDMAMFRQEDVSPLAGRTFYRVRMIDAQYGDMVSNVVEMQLAGVSNALGRVFPNPASNGMIHVEMTDEAANEGDASVQLFDVRGNLVAPRIFLPVGTGVINLPTEYQAAGVYFLRVSVGNQTETHRVIIE